MKKLIFTHTITTICGIASAQFSGGPQTGSLPKGFKPASTDTFIFQYPEVHAENRQTIFGVVGFNEFAPLLFKDFINKNSSQ